MSSHRALRCTIDLYRTWDDGTAYPEPCLDEYNQVTPQYALAWLAGGMASFAVLGLATTWSHPEKRLPFAPKETVYVPEELLRRTS